MINDVEEYFDKFNNGTEKPSLKAMNYFVNEYNNLHEKMRFIHIAGTNGKGSCTEIISNILIKQGYKVGKFLSPHLVRYNERISINGENISDKEMIKLLKELEPKIEKYAELENTQVTLFEVITIMALLYFYRNNVDFVVLETGLGGLNDATNVITKPLVSVITSIGYDHMQKLGNTLQDIAHQKAGIIKEDSNTVIFNQIPEINNVFIEECNKKKNSLYIVLEDKISNYYFDDEYQYFDYENMKNIAINLKGRAQIQNAAISLETFKILNNLGYIITEESIRDGLKTVVHRARMEQLSQKPLIIYDGGHNEPAIQNFKEMVNSYYSNFKRTYIISILRQKNYEDILKSLLKDKDGIFVLTSGNDIQRYASSKELYNVAVKYNKNNIYMKDLKQAIEETINGDFNTVNFIIGSFYIYGTANDIIKKLKE